MFVEYQRQGTVETPRGAEIGQFHVFDEPCCVEAFDLQRVAPFLGFPEIHRGGLQVKRPAHERPAAPGDLDRLPTADFEAQPAIEHFDTGIDRCQTDLLVGGRREIDEIREHDRPRCTAHRPERCGKIETVAGEAPAAAHDAALIPHDFPNAAEHAARIGDRAQCKRGERIRLELIVEAQVIHHEIGPPVAGLQMMRQLHLRELPVARGLVQRCR